MASSSVCDTVPDAASRYGTNYDYRNGVYSKPRYQKAPGDCSVMVSRPNERKESGDTRRVELTFASFRLWIVRPTEDTPSFELSFDVISLLRTRRVSSTYIPDPLMVESTFVSLLLRSLSLFASFADRPSSSCFD